MKINDALTNVGNVQRSQGVTGSSAVDTIQEAPASESVSRALNNYLADAETDAQGLKELKPENSELSASAAEARRELGFGSEVEVADYSDDRSRGTLIGLLRHRGYDDQEIYKKNKDGVTLLQRVADANDLENPDQIRAGQKLWLPFKLDKIKPTENDSPIDLKPLEGPTYDPKNPNLF